MATFIETGHAKNVANFEQLTSFIAGFGTAYNPSKASIKLAAMQTLLTNAKNVVGVVNSSLSANKNAVSARETAFKPLSKLATRIMNAVIATDTTPEVNENVKALVRKIQGKRATAKKTDEELQALAKEGKETRNVSSSQMSYDSRLDSFDKLIKHLTSIPLYAPNEADLKVATLTTMLNDLKAKNTAVVATLVSLSNARIARNDLMYKANTGMLDIALDSKAYIKSAFGGTSPQYKQVSKLKFTSTR